MWRGVLWANHRIKKLTIGVGRGIRWRFKRPHYYIYNDGFRKQVTTIHSSWNHYIWVQNENYVVPYFCNINYCFSIMNSFFCSDHQESNRYMKCIDNRQIFLEGKIQSSFVQCNIWDAILFNVFLNSGSFSPLVFFSISFICRKGVRSIIVLHHAWKGKVSQLEVRYSRIKLAKKSLI